VDCYPSLALAERLTLASAPVDSRAEWLLDEFANWVDSLARERPVRLEPIRAAFAKERAADDEELMAAEMQAKRLTLYSWLGFRFGETFPDAALCGEQRRMLDRFIERSLAGRSRGSGSSEGVRAGRTREPSRTRRKR
jgi:ATP-dependent RNA helicase SUPV3L1/SUV3